MMLGIWSRLSWELLPNLTQEFLAKEDCFEVGAPDLLSSRKNPVLSV
jgi:hypothetical protein